MCTFKRDAIKLAQSNFKPIIENGTFLPQAEQNIDKLQGLKRCAGRTVLTHPSEIIDLNIRMTSIHVIMVFN